MRPAQKPREASVGVKTAVPLPFPGKSSSPGRRSSSPASRGYCRSPRSSTCRQSEPGSPRVSPRWCRMQMPPPCRWSLAATTSCMGSALWALTRNRLTYHWRASRHRACGPGTQRSPEPRVAMPATRPPLPRINTGYGCSDSVGVESERQSQGCVRHLWSNFTNTIITESQKVHGSRVDHREAEK